MTVLDRYRCPACGARGYRGRRCGECLYEPFGEEVAHGTHYHAGEPLVLNTRPKSRPAGQGCDSYSGKRLPRIPKPLLIGLAVLVAALVPGGIWLVIIAAAVAKFAKKNQ